LPELRKEGEVEMNDRDEVIRELQTEIDNAVYPDRPRRFMIPLWLAEKALAALKEQVPRLMTLEEIKALPDYVFLEDRDISHAFSIKTISRPALPQLVFVNISGEECVGFRGPDGDTSLVTSRYGVEWRCWTSRPTDAQRKAVKWDD